MNDAPKQLEDVITPGSLASFLGSSAFEPLRETMAKVDELRAEGSRIDQKLIEVEAAIQSSGIRRVKDASRLADAVLRGEIPKADPEPEKVGLAACDIEELKAIAAGLRQKAQSNKSDVVWFTTRAKTVASELLRTAATAAATRYCALLNEAAGLHAQLGAAEKLLDGGLRSQIVPHDWSATIFPAPLVGVPPRQALVSDDFHQSAALFMARDQRGVLGAMDGWRDVVLAATGLAI